MFNVGEIDVFHLSKLIREQQPDIPIVLLTNFSRDIGMRIENEDTSAIDYTFYWHGNPDLILTIIKLIEDRMNADNDILQVGVQSILLVEDSVKYYSTCRRSTSWCCSRAAYSRRRRSTSSSKSCASAPGRRSCWRRTTRRRSNCMQKYKNNLLGVISDVGFVIHKDDPASSEKLDAGIDLCKLIKKIIRKCRSCCNRRRRVCARRPRNWASALLRSIRRRC